MARQAPSGSGRGGAGQGGVPDGLLIGLLAFLFGLTVLAWTATGLAGLFAHGGWPDNVSFARTPLALRALAVEPTDLPGAWPDTPPGDLSGHGLFWGLFIGELMVLLVLTVFAVGVVTRWRLVRKQRSAARASDAPAPVPVPQEAAQGLPREVPPAGPAPAPAPAVTPAETAVPAPATVTPHAPRTPLTHETAHADPVEAPAAYAQETAPLVPTPRTPTVLYGASATRRPAVVQAIRDADGPALVVTSDPTVWAETKDARSKLGPVLVYDPGHLCDTPARLHWAPTAGCEDPATAASRAAALLTPVRPMARIDAAIADTAETLLRCWLHAAAVDGRPFRQVHRWASGAGGHEPVRLLRTHPKAASGLAGLLESALTAYPERRDMAQELIVRAFTTLSSVHVREACTPNRADALVLDSFAREGGTLYVVGESIEDPRHHPGAMPLLTALASHVVEHGRRMAARSTDGRLDPPMTLVLDDVAAVAPLPQLPELLSAGESQGMTPLVLLRSEEQARARWREPLPAPGQR
ncbi:type VI secretion protein [[Kitasatospora] papulosa]|uniref:type IV secretory system conjugative DNA transfer family protein n=1 Tax=Streptomyces TaxID=1883 RepID=UPI00106DF3C5|nr:MULTISPECIES: type IV secretory system conjugative DNA transfer family protein [Streptomyces]MCX4414677.1 type VI secretion protein [[Kitasatospora] papulosa]MDF6063751.1 type VI secretion protein [Streptomyces sp. JH010]QBR07637.1 type VI secretion protein [Streptomyces sp. S501]